jgi:hypothetical protein
MLITCILSLILLCFTCNIKKYAEIVTDTLLFLY